MKRCPQCLFIYPETDKRCDFDNTPLVVVDEAELDAATNPVSTKLTAPAFTQTTDPVPPKTAPAAGGGQRRLLSLTAAVALVLGLVALISYYSFSRRTPKTAQTPSPISVSAEPATASQPSAPSPSPAEVASPSPSPSPTATPKPSAERLATSHSSTTVAPISTSGPGIGKRQGGRPVILLTSGGKIDADEVWRTRDGVWYRRDGIVTLLKHGRVKGIVSQ